MPSADQPRSFDVVLPLPEVLATEIKRLADLIHASGYDVVGFDPHVHGGVPHIEVSDDGRMHWIVKERGQVLEQRTTRDPDELLYWSFEATTFSLASRWEVQHRDESQDPRSRLWARQAFMLHLLNPRWSQRWRSELAARQPQDLGLLPQLPLGGEQPGERGAADSAP